MSCSLCVYSSPLGTCKHVVVNVHSVLAHSCQGISMCGCMCELVCVHVLHCRVTCLSNHVCQGCMDIDACVHEGSCVAIAGQECAHLWAHLSYMCVLSSLSLHRHPECLSRFAVSAERGNFCASHTCPCLYGAVCAHLLVHVLTEVCVTCMCFYVYSSMHMHTISFVGMCLGTEACFSLCSACPCICLWVDTLGPGCVFVHHVARQCGPCLGPAGLHLQAATWIC